MKDSTSETIIAKIDLGVETCGKSTMSDILDLQLTRLCEETGVIKKAFLRAIGSTPERYASKIKHNHLRDADREKLVSAVRNLGKVFRNFKFSADDNFSDVNRLKHLGLKKIRLAQILGVGETYVGSDLERRKLLPEHERKLLEIEIVKIGKKLEQFSFQ